MVNLIDGLGSYASRIRLHQPSYLALVQSASQGCELCVLLHASLFKGSPPSCTATGWDIGPGVIQRANTYSSTSSETGAVDDVASWHKELDARSDCVPFELEVKAEATLSSDFLNEYNVRYKRPIRSAGMSEGPKPRKLVVSNDYDLGLGIPNRTVADFPSFRLYSGWISDCAHGVSHRRCQSAEPTPLPVRVIDVGPAEGSSQPRLAITRGKLGHYLTLSHCWGQSRVLTTTSKNLITHIRGIPWEKFPNLFQDAMVITRILGYRYLWIDSLCIIQDDVADWENECSRMGDIYLNSICTLAAPGASDSAHRLLAERRPSDIRPCRLKAKKVAQCDGWVTIGLPPADLKEKNSVLHSRAWTLQEQILSPRTLYFGSRGMYFQCSSYEHFESYHQPLPPERMTPWRIAAASDLPKNLLSMASRDVTYWYSLVRQYSFRHMTFGDDKLPALSGLSNMLSSNWADGNESPFGSYWAGLWSKDLGRGLIWMSDPTWDPKKTLHIRDKLAPSWSWASQNTPVQWQSLQDFRQSFECVSCETELTLAHKYGRVKGGRLELHGLIRSISLSKKHSMKAAYLSDIRDTRQVAELVLDNSSAEVLEPVWSNGDAYIVCQALMLGKAESSLHGSRWFALVLLPIDGGRFRRIGICTSLTIYSTHPRSLTTEQSYKWFDNAKQANAVLV